MMHSRKALAVEPGRDADERFEAVAALVMSCLVAGPFSAEMPEYQKLLKMSRWEHANGCALGSVPTCTCGLYEVKNFISIVRSAKFVRKSVGMIALNIDTRRWHPVILIHHPRPSESDEDGGIRYKSRFHHSEGFTTEGEAEVWISERPDTVLVRRPTLGWSNKDDAPFACEDFPRSLTA